MRARTWVRWNDWSQRLANGQDILWLQGIPASVLMCRSFLVLLYLREPPFPRLFLVSEEVTGCDSLKLFLGFLKRGRSVVSGGSRLWRLLRSVLQQSLLRTLHRLLARLIG